MHSINGFSRQIFRSLRNGNAGKTAGLATSQLLVTAIFVLTFPTCSPALYPGLDASYVFAFNHFFEHRVILGKEIVFTYGPLGFLKFPAAMGYNLEIALVILSGLRLLFLASVFQLANRIERGRWGLVFVCSYFLLAYFSVDYLILGWVTVLVLLAEVSQNRAFTIVALFAAAFAAMVKINIGITSCLIIGSYVIYCSIKDRSLRPFIIPAISFPLFMILIWLLIYGKLTGIVDYIESIVWISKGNLSATALNTPNNWKILSLSFLSLALIPVMERSAITRVLCFCFVLVFYAVFRYSFAREENFHLRAFFDLVLLFSFLLILVNPLLKRITLVLVISSLLFYYLNMQLSGMYHAEDRMKLIGVQDFKEAVWDFKKLKENAIATSKANLAPSVLPEPILKRIGNATVDCFPWEISYIAANGLNYRPRPLFQVGCTNTPRLDERNALFYASPQAPAFIIWQRQCWSNAITSIDNRYLFNEDGQTLYQLLDHYNIVDSTSQVWILQRLTKDRLTSPKEFQHASVNWNEWVECPQGKGVTRMLVTCRNSFAGMLKSSLYKEKEYYIDYKLANGTEVSHRFVPDNAISGVWISPYLMQLNNALQGIPVKQVRIRSTDRPVFLKNPIELRWESFSLKDSL